MTFEPDISLGYEMPWTNDEYFVTIEFIPYFVLATSIHLILHLYFIRSHIYVELIASKMTVVDTTIKIDIKKFKDFCGSMTSEQKNLYVTVNV